MTSPSQNKYEFRAALYTSIGADRQPGKPGPLRAGAPEFWPNNSNNSFKNN
jgi:hypothetical protein